MPPNHAVATPCRAVDAGRMLLLAAIPALLAAGCATTVPLNPKIPDRVEPAPIAMTLGFLHDRNLLDDRRSVDAYGNRHEFILPLGAASDSLLRKIYPRLFTRVVGLDGWSPGTAPGSPIEVAIRPEIEHFQFPLQNLKGPYWAELRYRLTLYSAAGEVIHSWTVKGWGIGGDGSIYGESGPIAAAVEQALSSAGRKLTDSFANEPELKRWQRGQAPAGATAPVPSQKTWTDTDGIGREVVFSGLASVAARLSGTSTSRLAAVRIRIRNEGTGRLAIDPLTFAYALPGQPAIDPVPGAAVAAAASPRYGRIMPTPAATGVAALPNLFIGLINAAADAAERQALQANLARWEREELHESVVAAGDTAEGLVFFPLPPETPPTADLIVPLTAIDAASRHVVRIPLGGSQ